MNIEAMKEKNYLLELMEHGGSVQHALDIASKLLGNPTVLIDAAYNLLAHTENTVTDDPLWNELTTMGTFSHETVDFFNTEKFIEAYAKTDVVSIMISPKLKYDRIDGKLFDSDGLQIASIVVVACYKPLEDEDIQLLETICEVVAVVLQKSEFYPEIRQVFPETFMNDLIEGKKVDNIFIENTFNELCIEFKNNLYIAVVDVAQYEPTLSHLVYFKDLFEHMQSEFKYFVYLNYVVILINTDQPTISIKRDLRRLNEFFIKYGIFAGLSSSFDNLFEVQKYYKQALNALNCGISENNGQFIFKFDDYLLDYSLDEVKDKIKISDLCHPVIHLICQYDKENHTNYLGIIHRYILNGLNPELAAEKMQMNQNEFSENIIKIQNIFEIDWFNGNMLASIFMSIKILRTQE